MTPLAQQLRHPKEKTYGGMMLVAGIILWAIAGIAIGAAVFFSPVVLFGVLFYIGLIFLVMFIAEALLRAYIYGHYVMVGPNQFPQLHAMVKQAAATAGLAEAPTAFVFNSGGIMNAFAINLVGRRYVWLTSAIIDADTEAQVRFVVGHEIGHHAAGHCDFWRNLLKLPAHVIPFLGAAYSRAREFTCDRIGAHVAGDVQAARGALQMLACGSARLNAHMNADAFQAQESQVPTIAGWLLHIFSHYPRHTRRVQEVTTFSAANAGVQSRRAMSGADDRTVARPPRVA